MPKSGLNFPQVYLKPGELFLARQPTIILTILGSCIGATFWSRRLGAGALCHAMLPRCPERVARDRTSAKGRQYVDFCLRELARHFDEMGAVRSEVEVKLFGGADVLTGGVANRPTVGKLNCEMAMDVLREEGFVVSGASLGDRYGRKIRFNTESGDVLMMRLK